MEQKAPRRTPVDEAAHGPLRIADVAHGSA